MRRHISRFFVVLLAVAFAAGGMAWQSCLALQPAPASNITAQHRHADLAQSPAESGKHHHHQTDEKRPAGHTDQQPSSDHSCMKCCSLCIASAVAPTNVNESVVFTVSSIIFNFEKKNFFGRTIRIDPGIPKRIV
jgi:hypothetical protein